MSDEQCDDAEMEGVEMEDEVPEDLDEKITGVREQLSRNPYDYQLNNELLSLLRKNGDLEELAETREKTSAQYPLSSTNWVEWIQDERLQGSEQSRIEELFKKAVFDCNSVDVWMELVQWACGVDPKFAREKFEDAVSAIGLRVDVGAMIWQSYLCFEEAMFSGDQIAIANYHSRIAAIWRPQLKTTQFNLPIGDETNEKQKKTVASLYKRALRVPNVDLADTWKSYLEFAGEEVDEDIRAVYETTTNEMKDFSKYELKLAESDDGLDAFYEYLNFEKDKDDPARIQAFYNRMLDKHHQDENVWFDYGQWCETKLKVHPITCRVYRQAVRHCPYSCALWQQTLLALERGDTPAVEVDELWSKARETISSADDGRALYRTYIYMLRRRADSSDKDLTKMAEVFEEGQRNLMEWFGKHDWDPQALYRRNWAYFAYSRLNDFKKGHQIWEDILASGGGRFAEKWIEAVRLERQYGTVESARKLLYRALNSVSDHPAVVFEYFIQFEREEGTLEQLDKALEKVNAQALQRASRLQSQKPKDESAGKKVHGKEKRSAEATEFKSGRKRTATDYGDVPAKKQAAHVPSENSNLVEQPVSKDKDGFAMPMLPVKKTSAQATSSPGSSGQPSSSDSTNKEKKFTVFISNLDFKTTPEQVKEVLDGVVEVRLVYRGMSKLTKGYGFVDLDSEKSFREALAKDRIPIQGRPMLISISDPERRPTFKYSTDLEKTKLFIKNVHYDCTEEQLRDAFKVFGEVKAVRIVTHISGKPKGVAYVEFANEDDARKAILEPEIILLDRKLHVAISNPPKKPPKEESTRFSSTPIASTSTDRKTHLSMVPRVVNKPSAKVLNGINGEPKKAMSNDEFRQMLKK